MLEKITKGETEVCAVPEFSHVAKLKLQTLLDRGYRITGYALEKPQTGALPVRGFINHGGFVGWWMGDEPTPDAPKSPEDVPVALPEPVAQLWQHGETGRTRVLMPDAVTDCDAQWRMVSALYTEQQVIELLKSTGVSVKEG